MEKIALQLIEQLNSSVFVLLGIIALAGWALFRLGRWMEVFSQHDKRLDKVEAIHDKVIALSTKIDLIYNNTNPRSVVTSHSPLALTPLGHDVVQAIDAESLFAKYRNRLFEFVQARCPQGANAYDIQVAAMNIAKTDFPSMLNADEVNLLKQTAYDKGMLYEDILPVFGIMLRDKVLSDRNIPVVDVDRHDPVKNA